MDYLEDKLKVVVTTETIDDHSTRHVISEVMGQEVFLTAYALEESLMEAYEAFAGLLKSNSLSMITGSDINKIVKAKEDEINIFRREHGSGYADMFIAILVGGVALKESVDYIKQRYEGVVD